MQEQISKLQWELTKLNMMINVFSDAFEYCIEDNKHVDHLYFLNKLIVKKIRYVMHKCDEVAK